MNIYLADQLKQHANELVEENRHITLDEICAESNVSHEPACATMHDKLYRKVCARWIPKQLKEMKFDIIHHTVLILHPLIFTCLDHLKMHQGCASSGMVQALKMQCTVGSLSKTFFSDGIRKLVSHWTKYVERGGDYIEK
jgi:hypothetical protein